MSRTKEKFMQNAYRFKKQFASFPEHAIRNNSIIEINGFPLIQTEDGDIFVDQSDNFKFNPSQFTPQGVKVAMQEKLRLGEHTEKKVYSVREWYQRQIKKNEDIANAL